MTTYDPGIGARVFSPDPDDDRRAALLRELGLDVDADPECDEIATDLGEKAAQPWAMVNFFTKDKQHFAGLYVAAGAPPVDRTMARNHGFCPGVVNRPVAMVLPDVCAHPHFRSNVVVDQLGVRTYSGSPLRVPEFGLSLGTVCFIGPEQLPEETADPNLLLVNAIRDEVVGIIRDRARATGLIT
ncbi:hypothetical protein SAMN05216251_12749 [Actinacidiphila alni]|uniref:GAF domain-containing protein n=1 Tax=Actinacidiphila alni TaxID=380248 RepID=A0A1I2L850_9ACTN|nr:GAF domain-containing protein [Actinacidiphila alni]SFF75123.1 hypothetical protein SAMN05216251_12749 [Actinacidiphila alni]